MLKEWYESNVQNLRDRGFVLNFSGKESDGVVHSSAVDLDSRDRLGRLTIWEGGAAHLQVLEVSSGAVLVDEHREMSGRVGFEDAVSSLVAHVSHCG